MKIAINIEHFIEAKGGAERYVIGLANSLAEKGHDLHILANSWYEGCEKDFRCHRIPLSLFRTLRDIKFARETQNKLLEEKFDLSLSFGRSLKSDIYQPHGGVHRAYLERELKSVSTPFLRIIKFLLQTISLRHLLIKRIEKVIFSRQNLIVVAISEMVKRDIISFYSFPEERIRVIHNGVDLEKFNIDKKEEYRKEIRNRYLLNDKDFFILFVANNFRLKGLRNLIRAVSLMKKNMNSENSFQVFILGNGRRTLFERLATRLGCKNEFQFIGSTGNMEKFYAAADVLALPTFYDPCSLTTLEAMASGLPVITSTCNGAAELVENGVHGFVLDDPENHVELSEKLMLFFDRHLRDQMGANARRKIENFPSQKNTREMLLLCEEISGNKKD